MNAMPADNTCLPQPPVRRPGLSLVKQRLQLDFELKQPLPLPEMPPRCPTCIAVQRGRVPASDRGMADVLTWLFKDGSSSVVGTDAETMSLASLQVPPAHWSVTDLTATWALELVVS